MTNSERKKLAQKKAFARMRYEQKKYIEERKEFQKEYIKTKYNSELNDKECLRSDQNCLFLLKKDFGISYAEMAELFGYRSGYVYSFSSFWKEVPLPLQRFCQAYRRIKFLENKLKEYEELKKLLSSMLSENLSQNSSFLSDDKQ